MSRQKTYANIVETTFDTPLVKLNSVVPADAATVLVKLEFFNPFSSVKDRIGRSMIETAEKAGILSRIRILLNRRAAIRASPWRSWPRPSAIGSRSPCRKR